MEQPIKLTEFQEYSMKVLREGSSPLLIAPTGLGKTIAAVEPFVTGKDIGLLGTRLIYTLPMRALVSGVKDDLDSRLIYHRLNRCNIKCHQCATIHHGQQTDSEMFREPAIITTIDQYLTAFAGVPLSFAAKSGHAVAGALLTSYSVFDEVHLLDARAGLPLLFAMLYQRQDWGLRSCVLTATLPKNVIKHFETYLGMQVVRAEVVDPTTVEKRDSQRKVTLHFMEDHTPTLLDEPESPVRLKAIKEAFTTYGRTIIFCNTVPKALKLYEALCNYSDIPAEAIVLTHSRFAPSDRKIRDLEVSRRFGKEGQGGILITTQVAEAGLNISAPIVFSELAPADALIQRAGRCARFFHDFNQAGEFRVWPLYPDGKSPSEKDRQSFCLPYDLEVIEKTQESLVKLDGNVLNWQAERDFVDDSLSVFYAAFASGQNLPKPQKKADEPTKKKRPNQLLSPLTPVTALGAFEQAFHSSESGYVESLLRDSVTVNVGIIDDIGDATTSFNVAAKAYNNPGKSEPGKPLPRILPETISLRPSTFAGLFLEKTGKQVRRVDIHRKDKREDKTDKPPLTLERISRVEPGKTYWILDSQAGYSRVKGLTGSGEGIATAKKELPIWEKGQKDQRGERQCFKQHALGAHKEAKRLLKLYRPFLAAWAEAIPVAPNKGTTHEDIVDALQSALEMAVLLHDVGKLNEGWQNAVGRKKDEPPIARTTEAEREALKQQGIYAPHHAQYVYPLLKHLLRGHIGPYRMLDHLALAAARHHVLTLDGDFRHGEFRWAQDGRDREVIQELITEVFGDNLSIECLREACDLLEADGSADEAPGPASNTYFLYCLTNRLVIHADRCDAGAGPLELVEGYL